MLTCRRNFTLIELMITVALVGILSSIAITSAAEMQYKAKRGELPLNIDGIKAAELVYEAANDQFIDSGRWLPEKTVGRSLRNWANSLKFKALGWTPDGQVRGSYRVRLRDSDFLLRAKSDIDGDGQETFFQTTRDTVVVDSYPDRY